jgi:hypothetical protein
MAAHPSAQDPADAIAVWLEPFESDGDAVVEPVDLSGFMILAG